jgi:two-component system, cell cycle response regulator
MSHTVLVVDDSIPLHKLIKAQLEAEPLELHSAYDGESALTAAATLRPALILLDVDMPELDGFEVCRRLKANPTTAPIPVIFLTANALLNDKVQGLEIGGADYVTKPFKPEELRARVRASLRAKHLLDKTAMVDPMTGLWNRAYLDLHLKAQLSLARRANRSLSCLILEVDRYVMLSGTHGAAVLHEALRGVARIMLSQCRAEDLICRFGDAKFLVLVNGANRAAAARVAERLRGDVERQLAVVDGIHLAMTCSIGVADTLVASDETLLDRADAAVCRARQHGRNAVFVARPAGDEPHAAVA